LGKGLIVKDHFVQEVQVIVGPLLSSLGFSVSTVDDDVDEGGRRGSVVIYRAQDCKVQLYYSSREGEINAMIGPLDAPDVHGLHDHSRKWHYFTDFATQPKLSLEELVQKNRDERANFETTSRWLEWLKSERIARYFDQARAAIAKGQ
jgi:hypothetical protein